MRRQERVKTIVKLLVLSVAAVMAGGVQARPTAGSDGKGPAPVDFVSAAPQGFGDRQNSVAWSMAWWRGKLYVGTARSGHCVQRATTFFYYPGLKGVLPLDPDIECEENPYDLPLQAEIWRWTPETNVWDRVFQSPNDVPIPDPDNPGQSLPGKVVARDIGFRGMIGFTEPDGTEALYVAGVSSRSFNPWAPPPRILRSTDGETFMPLPQDPGTFLGDIQAAGFRSLAAYKGRLYVTASAGLLGHGVLLESGDPVGGNDTFRQVTPPDMTLYEINAFNGYLYLGGGNRTQPYTIWKTDATGWPYTFRPVVTEAAYHPGQSRAVVSMREFQGRLYIGTDAPAEVLRINPDDTWDLVVGASRDTPAGRKEPLSGMDVGFNWQWNLHIWRMGVHKEVLYIGTYDASTNLRATPGLGQVLAPMMGFDLFASRDGVTFSPITRTGFGDKFSVGVRTFASTPYGLFVGDANGFYGLHIWREVARGGSDPGMPGGTDGYRTYIPFVMADDNVVSAMGQERIDAVDRGEWSRQLVVQ